MPLSIRKLLVNRPGGQRPVHKRIARIVNLADVRTPVPLNPEVEAAPFQVEISPSQDDVHGGVTQIFDIRSPRISGGTDEQHVKPHEFSVIGIEIPGRLGITEAAAASALGAP